MPFKKGITPPGAKVFVKGRSGNLKGRPHKLATALKVIGYTKAEASETINCMLAMTIDELKRIYENPHATILEKTIAGAMNKSLQKGSLYSLDTLLSRVYGKPKEQMDIQQDTKIEVVFVEGKTIL